MHHGSAHLRDWPGIKTIVETDRCPSPPPHPSFLPRERHPHTHTHTQRWAVLSSSPLHLSAYCCQAARQQVMFVPSGSVISSFGPLLSLSLPLPPPSLPFLFLKVWHLLFKKKKKKSRPHVALYSHGQAAAAAGSSAYASDGGPSAGMNLTRAPCQGQGWRGEGREWEGRRWEGSDEKRHLASPLPASILPLSLIQLAAAPFHILLQPLNASRQSARGREMQMERRGDGGVSEAEAKSGGVPLYAGLAGSGGGWGCRRLRSGFSLSSPAGPISM